MPHPPHARDKAVKTIKGPYVVPYPKRPSEFVLPALTSGTLIRPPATYPIPLAPLSKPYNTPLSMASFLSAASRSISFIVPPQVALYPLAKNPNVIAKSTSSAVPPCAARPQNKNAAIAELMADMAVTVCAESWKCLLSLKKPKKVDEQIPGMLMSVMSSVENVGDKEDTLRAYSLR